MAEANAGQLGMLFGSHFASPHYNDVTGNFEKALAFVATFRANNRFVHTKEVRINFALLNKGCGVGGKMSDLTEISNSSTQCE